MTTVGEKQTNGGKFVSTAVVCGVGLCAKKSGLGGASVQSKHGVNS